MPLGTFFSPKQEVTVALALLRLSLNVFIVYISLARLKKQDTIRVFTMNLIFACFVNDLIISINETCIMIDGFGWITYRLGARKLFYRVCGFMQNLVTIEYPFMSLFFVVVSSLPYTAPLFYAKHLASGKWTRYYVVIHAFSYIHCVVSISAPIILDKQTKTLKAGLDALAMFLSIVSFATLLFTLRAVLAVARYKSTEFTSRVNAQSRRRLICFLIYCIPMNIISLPLTIDGLMTALIKINPNWTWLYAITLVATRSHYVLNHLRTTIIGICTLLALTPYRAEIRKMMPCHSGPT